MSEKDRETGELVLRKVPTLVTVGWHGVGSVRGARFGGVAMMQSVAQAPCAPMMKDMAIPIVAYRESMGAGSFMPGEMVKLRMNGRAGTAPASGDTTDTDLLMALLSLQRVDGGFDLDDAALVRLGIKPAEIAGAATSLPGDARTALRVLHTAIVLAALESRFADERETWFAAVRKSRTWLKQATAGWGAVAGGKTVARWAQDLAAKAAQ